MNAKELQEFGITKKQVLDAIVAKVLYSDSDGEDFSTRFLQDMRKYVAEAVQKKVKEVADETVIPHVEECVEGACLQKTNEWGDKRGPAMTFKEYLIHCAENYMKEPVNFHGKTREQDSYSWQQYSTRLVYLIHEHLHFTIESEMKKALSELNAKVSGGLAEGVKVAMAEVLKKLSVKVETR